MYLCLYFSFFFSFFIINFVCGTIDVNFSEFQYLADHLTGKECSRLVAALHFHTFELPEDIDAAERRIPEGVPCIDLLTHWNATPKEGKGETHIAICHRLNQIGREDLAKWLSKTVSHEISKDLTLALAAQNHPNVPALDEYDTTENSEPEVVIDEAAWWELDSVLEILNVFCIIILIFGSVILLYLCCTINVMAKNKKLNYEKVNTYENYS